ncbi:ATP-binding protein [Streptomyces sp. NPDC023838]|uniref:ATP-binding protein n=1 Tax=Streptomyces sp. NPDC023838 TaxID=3154325 RepID=UPI0033CFBD98
MHPETEASAVQLSVTVRVFRRRIAATRRGARLARLLSIQQLAEWGVPRGSVASDAAALIVAELAANAVVHARVPGRDFELVLILRAGGLRIEVTDTRADKHPVAASAPPPDAESGRGLLLVQALAERWGVAEGAAPRKTVWAELGL